MNDSEMALDDLYREVVLDHYRRPRGRAALARADASARGFNPVCGDEVEVRVALAGDRLTEVQVDTRGCAICSASGSMLAEMVPGLGLDAIQAIAQSFRALLHGRVGNPEIDLGDLDALRGVAQFPVRVKCAMLPWVTLEQALAGQEPGVVTTVASTEREETPR